MIALHSLRFTSLLLKILPVRYSTITKIIILTCLTNIRIINTFTILYWIQRSNTWKNETKSCWPSVHSYLNVVSSQVCQYLFEGIIEVRCWINHSNLINCRKGNFWCWRNYSSFEWIDNIDKRRSLRTRNNNLLKNAWESIESTFGKNNLKILSWRRFGSLDRLYWKKLLQHILLRFNSRRFYGQNDVICKISFRMFHSASDLKMLGFFVKHKIMTSSFSKMAENLTSTYCI